MAFMIVFFLLIAILALGITTLGKWWPILGILIFCLDAWAFWEFLGALKR